MTVDGGAERREARERVIRHQGLVRSVAANLFRTMPPRTDLEDLVAYGQVGLVEAASDYDPGMGARFTTYAYYRIRGAILEGAYKMSWYNRTQVRRFRFQKLANEALQAQRDSEGPAADPLESSCRAVGRMMVVGLALDLADSAGATSGQRDDREARPDENAARAEAFRILRQTIDDLPLIERELIQATYFRGETLTEFAKRTQRHKSWASRLHDRALDHLAASMRLAGVSEAS